MSIKNKYLKYKYKYLELKQIIQTGGQINITNYNSFRGGGDHAKSGGSASGGSASGDNQNQAPLKRTLTPWHKMRIPKLIDSIKTYIMNLLKPEEEREIITDFDPITYIYNSPSTNLLTLVNSNDDNFVDSILDSNNNDFIIFKGNVLISASKLKELYKEKYALLEKKELQKIAELAKQITDEVQRLIFITTKAETVVDEVNKKIDELGSAEYNFVDNKHITSIVIKNPRQHPFDSLDGVFSLRDIQTNPYGNLLVLIDIITDKINKILTTSYESTDFEIHITRNENGTFGTLLVNPSKKLTTEQEELLLEELKKLQEELKKSEHPNKKLKSK